MRRNLVIPGLILVASLLAATFVLAQDQGLRVGSSDDSVSSDAVMEELRTIHEQLGALLARLEDAPTTQTDVGQLEQRIAALERQVRGQTVRSVLQELESLRAGVEGDGDRERASAEVERLRSELERTFAGADDRDIDWESTGKELRTKFDALVEQLSGEEDPMEAFETAVTEVESLAERIRRSESAGADDEPTTEDSESEAMATEAEDSAEEPFEWETEGPQIYAENCAACHQANGQGVEGAFPPLAGNPFVTGNPEAVIQVVLHGRGGMPSFGSLSDREVAAVISHERNAWDNAASEITPDMVETVRAGDTLEDTSARPGAAD